MLGDFRAKPKRKLQWLLWWQIDPDELQEQAAKYNTLGWLDAARKLSVLFLILSTVVTLLFVPFGPFAGAGYVEAAILAVLAGFIYRGHRWAMIAAMILWTLEKALGAVGLVTTNPLLGIFQILWWCLYMHTFYLAFRVEQERKRSPAVTAADFN